MDNALAGVIATGLFSFGAIAVTAILKLKRNGTNGKTIADIAILKTKVTAIESDVSEIQVDLKELLRRTI